MIVFDDDDGDDGDGLFSGCDGTLAISAPPGGDEL